MFELERRIRVWADYLRRRGNFLTTDIQELEGHLREEIDSLGRAGLSQEEAFLVAVKRMGNADALSREFSKVNTESLWKQLVLLPEDPQVRARARTELLLVVLCALAAGTLAKIPELFGLRPFAGQQLFYLKNLSLFVFPFVVLYFLWKRRAWSRPFLWLLLPFAGSALAVNLYPSFAPHHNVVLAGIHLPILLWFVVGVAYVGGRWRDPDRRMDFVRFSGESFIYGVLLLCGGFVLAGLTNMIFSAINVDVTSFLQEYLVIYGGLGAVVVATYLAEAKKSVVENMAPVLARIFSPLLLVVLLSFVAVMAVLGKSPYTEREFLIGFDLMLALVVGLVLYVISARDPEEKPGLFDAINLVLIVVALAVDGIALSAILFRISSYGFTANKMAALGENIVLLANLGGLTVLYALFFAGKRRFTSLEHWQTAYLPTYAVWAAVVVFLFPVVFRYQ
jgi:hypothetical protein